MRFDSAMQVPHSASPIFKLMPSQGGMTAVWQMKMPGGISPARHLETG